MSSPAVSKAPKKLASKTGTPSKTRKGSGSSAAPSVAESPKSVKKTPSHKLTPKAPKPIDDDLEEQSLPETPSPKSKKKSASSEQRRPISPPDDAISQASGSAAPLSGGGSFSGLAGKAKGFTGLAKDTVAKGAGAVKNAIPFNLSALKGLQVADGGKILGQDGNPLGEVVEGDEEDLVGQTVGDDGEILDEDGDLIGRVDILHELAEQATNESPTSKLDDELKNVVTDLAQLEGLSISDGGVIKNSSGHVVGKIVEGDPEDLIGYTLNDEGEIVDDEGDAIGRAELVPVEEQKKAIEGTVGDANGTLNGIKEDVEDAEDGLPTDQADDVVNQAKSTAEDVAEGAEDAVPDVDDVASDAEDAFPDTKDVEDAVPGVEEATSDTGDVLPDTENLDKAAPDADGVAKKAEDAVPDTDGVEGAAPDVDETTKKAGDAFPDTEDVDDAVSGVDDVAEKAEDAVPDADDLDEAVPETGDVEDAVPDVDEVKETAEDTVDDAQETAEDAAEDAQLRIPDLDTLEGLTCNKRGWVIDQTSGKPVGELVEGDPKKISKLGAKLDEKGQFWDNKGNVIGKVKALPVNDDQDEEGPFSGLEGLVVVQDGWIEDENQTRVGRLIEGDAKKLLGRGVDEDGEVLDRRGSVIGRAERWEEPEPEPEVEEVPDLSILNGLSCNKAGYVIGSEGFPIGRVVEGNPKELTGKKIEDGEIYSGKKVVGRVELIPDDELENRPEGPFAGMESLYVTKDGFVEDDEGAIVGKLVEGDAKKLRGRAVDEDGEITDKYGNVKGRAEPYEVPEEEEEVPEEEDLSALEGKVVNKMGNVVDPATGAVVGRIVEGDKRLAGRKVDGKGQIWGDNGQIIGRAELIPGAEQHKAEGPFFGFDNAEVGKDGVIIDAGRIIGRLIEGDAKRLLGRKVDEDGDVIDKNGNTIGKAERWEPEEKKRDINPMSGRKVNKEGEVRDADGNLIGKLTSGNVATLAGKSIDDNGYVVDNDGNRVGECTLLENIPEPESEPEPEPEPEVEEGPSPEELEAQAKAEHDRDLARKMSNILSQTIEQVKPICKMITEKLDKADRTPKEELDEEKLVKDVKPLIEEGGRILQECNGAIRALDPDGRIAATAKARASSKDATPEEYQLADQIKELTETVVKTIDNGRRRIADMPHAKKKLNPLWGLLSEPLFQIIAAVGLLLNGVLGLVGRLLDGLGLGGLLNGILGALGLDKIINGLGLGGITDALGLGSK
ncbi:hypothetical protein N7495_003085 [Penicillium taxi]|uniref:uncharacterized protein n=1 Tax=Penicillium taxi TaxID=168475 RepID=UPI002545AEC2|nr:uncharacterized protein N7495_003085 [Penicillium taxi]KAJ5902557.1 hypothetical protein N7495_003085 [Penicillium taxi]